MRSKIQKSRLRLRSLNGRCGLTMVHTQRGMPLRAPHLCAAVFRDAVKGVQICHVFDTVTDTHAPCLHISERICVGHQCCSSCVSPSIPHLRIPWFASSSQDDMRIL